MNTSRYHPFAIAMVALAVTASLTAQADPPTRTPAPPIRMTVRYSDLDLSTEAGIRALYNRIQAAAERGCFWAASDRNGIDHEQIYAACYGEAVANAVRQLNYPRLAALH